MSLFPFNDFVFMFNPFNNFIQLLLFHSKILILYSITACLCNNNIFIQQHVFDSVIINLFYKLDFPSVLCCFSNFDNSIQKFHFHSKPWLCYIIWKCYIHSRTYFHSKTLYSFNNSSVCIYTDMTEKSRNCMISTYKNRRKVTYVSYRLKENVLNNSNWR